jgi:hypothetical protein
MNLCHMCLLHPGTMGHFVRKVFTTTATYVGKGEISLTSPRPGEFQHLYLEVLRTWNRLKVADNERSH